jgi:NAD(P)-dependent dehydrogenase (short-subunit alcohol dehydrogenase family)
MTARRQTAVITGAAHGIGRASATALADAGFRVVIVDVDDAAGETTLNQLGGEAAGHSYLHADLTDVSEITRAVDTVVQCNAHLDVLVNNAGVTRAIDFFDVTVGEWDRILQLNARGYFFTMQAAARNMAPGSSIVNIASIAGKGWKETSNIAYASSKGAVLAMTRIAASRLGASGIRVNAVCPGMTKTELMMNWLAGRARHEGVHQADLLVKLAEQVPLGLLNESADVAAAVRFLATDASRTITGQSINVDGGILFD